jgi:hypothetical protein
MSLRVFIIVGDVTNECTNVNIKCKNVDGEYSNSFCIDVIVSMRERNYNIDAIRQLLNRFNINLTSGTPVIVCEHTTVYYPEIVSDKLAVLPNVKPATDAHVLLSPSDIENENMVASVSGSSDDEPVLGTSISDTRAAGATLATYIKDHPSTVPDMNVMFGKKLVKLRNYVKSALGLPKDAIDSDVDRVISIAKVMLSKKG